MRNHGPRAQLAEPDRVARQRRLPGNHRRVRPVRRGLRSLADLREKLQVPATAPEGKAYRLNVTADSPGQFVIQHVFLRPVDHVNGADPDIVRYLRESSLPVLRWPGGNFVSTYHWEDGIGASRAAPNPVKPGLGRRGAEYIRNRRIHRVLPHGRVRTDDLRQCRQRITR